MLVGGVQYTGSPNESGKGKWDFFVASSDHATAVEGHAHQGVVCSCGLGNLLLANCELLRKTFTSTCDACFRMLCMCILKIRKEKKKKKLNL